MPTVPGGATQTDSTWITSNAASFDYTLSNVEFVSQIVSFNSETESLFKSMLSQIGGIQWDFNTPYHLSTTSLGPDSSESATQWVLTLPVRSRNTNSVFHLIQSLGDRSNILNFGLSALRANKTTSFQHRIGGVVMPMQPITVSANNVALAYHETTRCFKSPADTHSPNMLQKSEFNTTSANLTGSIFAANVVGLLADVAKSTAETALVVKAASGHTDQVGAVGTKGSLMVGDKVASFTIAASNTFTLGTGTTWADDAPIRILSIDTQDRPDDIGKGTLEFYPSSGTNAVCSFVPALSLQTYDDSGLLSGVDYSNQTLNLELILNCSHSTGITQAASYALISGICTLQSDGQLFASI